ncbi:MAG: hypothetical protein IPL61_11470 [Myxococcales bacterium]|nr:hypothetical protein [Myxococcales bacterium]
MICPTCEVASAPGAVFCARCGASFVGLRDLPPEPYRAQGASAPQPYQPQPYPPQPYPPQPYPPQPYPPQPYAMVPVMPMAMAPWRCMRCGYAGQAMMVQKISSGGWVLFAVLLLFFFPLCWIGLLMKDTRCQCPMCRVMY